MDSAAPGASDADRGLAQANLLRVRGEFGAAKAALTAILADRPNDRETLALMARTCDDAGETEEAARWRGLSGGRPAEVAPSAPKARGGVPAFAVPAVVGLALLVLALGYGIGRESKPAVQPEVVGGRVEAPGTASTAGEPIPPLPDETAGGAIVETPAKPENRPGETDAEARGLARLREADGGSPRALAVSHDPRGDAVTVTFAPRAGEPVRREAASLARAGFGAFPTAKLLQMRAVRGGDLVYVATAARERLSAVESEGWARENAANPDALADALLSDEWNAGGSPPENSPGGP